MWEIYAYHNTESLFGIFNAVAAIMASGTYLSAIAAVGFCGFVAAMLAYMLAPEKLQGWKWLGTVVLVYAILFVPRVSVGIVDKTGGSAVRVVDNVPFGMAALGGLTSTIGNTITELFETAFQTLPGPAALPSELSYQRSGLMFGSRTIQETRRASLPDPAVRTDLVNFVGNCTTYDIADGTISPTDFSTTADLWTLMANTNPARFSIVTTGAGVTTTTCDQAYASINGRMPAQLADLTARVALRLNPSLTPAAADGAVSDQVLQAYLRSNIADASATAAGLIRQNALINAVTDAGEMGCQRINDPSCMMLATGRAAAVAQQNAAWINGAKIAEQALPVVRNVAEAMCYAVFPLVVLLLFLTSGRNTVLMLAGYATVLISIQLWPPLFALLNYMASIYAHLDQAAAASIGGGARALSMQTGSPIYSNAVSAQAVVSYLVIGIPPLAYGLANRMVNFGTALTTGLSGLQSTVGNASAAAATGNVGMGNITMDQRVVSPSTSNAWVSRQQTTAGDWQTTDGTGRVAISMLRNEGLAARVVSARVSQSAVSEASRAADAARSEAVSANTDRSAALVDVVSRASSRSTMNRSTSGTGVSSFEEIGQAADRISALTQQVHKATGLSAEQAQQIAFQLSGGIGVGTPSVSPIKAQAGLQGSAGKSYSSRLTENEQKVLNALTSEQLNEFKRFGDRVSRDTGFLRAISSEGREGKELAARMTETTSRSESAQAVYSERVGIAERLSQAHERGDALSIDLAQLPQNSDFMVRYARLAAEYGPDSQALQVAIASELATRALPPTRYFSDGSSVPGSGTEVRRLHSDHVAEQTHPADIDRVNQRNTAKVGLRPVGPGSASGSGTLMSIGPDGTANAPTGLTSLRGDVASTGAALKDDAARQVDGFDQRNEVTRDPDGTVGTKKSLAATNARQAVSDVRNLGENVLDAVRGKKK